MATSSERDQLGTLVALLVGAMAGLIVAVPALPRDRPLLVAGLELGPAETALVLGAGAIVALPVVVLLLSAVFDL
ncbi:hypothetical protein [Halosegnis marinus]|uniref:Uncharacterized protein n=1 Tax=Halosegnis marinus TaxID=3034023 RepID=A0ABD5ZSF7_9EURY|nr:hypothetical protein [Halosegnis sp. DT85]